MCGINYKKMIVSFIDILGFKDIIYREKDNPDFVNTILEILSLLQNLSGEHTDSSASEGNYFSFVFSDSMVRLTGINKDSEILEKLYNEINHLAYIQLNIINEHYLKNCHFLIRGAITIGDIYYNIEKARIFGPAFNLSYKLESEKSKYPRIIIDPEIYKDYLQGVKYKSLSTSRNFTFNSDNSLRLK